MTKQECHTCDRCGAEFKVPQSSIGSIPVFNVNDNPVIEDIELCFRCYEAFKDFMAGVVTTAVDKEDA